MDVLRALIGGANGGTVTAIATPVVPPIQADTRAVISQIAADSSISPPERVALTQIAVDIDRYIQSQPLRAGNLDQVAGLGIYLSKTSATTWPRWNVMTALRAYGLNLNESVAGPAPSEQAAARQVAAQLEAIARTARNVSAETATVQAPVAVQQAAVVVAATAVPAATPRPAAPRTDTPPPAAPTQGAHVDAVV